MVRDSRASACRQQWQRQAEVEAGPCWDRPWCRCVASCAAPGAHGRAAASGAAHRRGCHTTKSTSTVVSTGQHYYGHRRTRIGLDSLEAVCDSVEVHPDPAVRHTRRLGGCRATHTRDADRRRTRRRTVATHLPSKQAPMTGYVSVTGHGRDGRARRAHHLGPDEQWLGLVAQAAADGGPDHAPVAQVPPV